MRLNLLALASALAGMSLLVTGIASADIVTDATLAFTATSGGPTPTGSWSYDDSSHMFTSFTVTWDGIVSTFTDNLARNPSVASANSGTWCGAAPGAQAPLPSCQYFAPGDFLMDDLWGGGMGTFTDYFAKGQGTYTIATERTFNTPEPSTLALFGAAIVGLGYALRRRRRDGLRAD
jgi:hypothetical protein